MKNAIHLIGVCLFLSGCVCCELRTADIQYYNSGESEIVAATGTPDPAARDSRASRCIRVSDQRARTVAEGWSLPREQIRDWLVTGIESRLRMGVEYSAEPPSTEPYLALEMLYVRQIATSVTGVTVLRVHEAGSSYTARGNSIQTNWTGSDRQYSQTLSQSLDAALARLKIADLALVSCQ